MTIRAIREGCFPLGQVKLVPAIQWGPDKVRGKPKLEPWQHDFATPEGYMVRVQWLLVTPILSRLLLDANTHNRNQSSRTIDQYRRALVDKDFPFVGNTIVVADDGILLDGQHRALAIEESGVPLWCLVIGGLPVKIQRHIDVGRGRSSADQAKIDGVNKATVAAASARLLLEWHDWRNGRGDTYAGKPEVTKYLEQHRGTIETGMQLAAAVHKTVNKGISQPSLVAAYVRAQQVLGEPWQAAEFLTMLATGDDLRQGQPAHALLHTYIQCGSANRLLNLYQFVLAFNAHLRKQTLTKRQIPQTARSVAPSRVPDIYIPGGAEPQQFELDED